MGVENLAAAIGEERDTIEDVIEPYLIQQGFLMRTPRGRVATPGDIRNLAGGKGNHAESRIVAIHHVEVVKIAPCRAHDHDASLFLLVGHDNVVS